MKKLLVVLALSACATASNTFIATGQTLQSAGQEFVATAALFDRGLDSGAITVEQYAAWRDFGHKFKATYPVAVELWKAAQLANDDVLSGKVQNIITDLVSELVKFYALVTQALQEWNVRVDSSHLDIIRDGGF